MNIFLSWSGNLSKAIASGFNEILPDVIQRVKPFFSPEKIGNGEVWFTSIVEALKASDLGIVFLTKDNFNEDWIIFEGGGIIAKGWLYVILCDFTIAEFNKSECFFKKLNVTEFKNDHGMEDVFVSMKNRLGLTDIKDETIRRTFKHNWPAIKDKIYSLIKLKFQPKPTAPDLNKDILKKLIGTWELKLESRDGKMFGEIVTIDKDGRYNLHHSTEGVVYYFQLGIIPIDSENFNMDKIQVFNDIPSQFTHAKETLHFTSSTEIHGVDNFGNKLIYKKN